MNDEKKKREHVGRTVEQEIHIEASPGAVWEAWADPERIARWFVDRAEGYAEPDKVVTWFFDTFGFAMPVPVVEAEPGKKLTFAGEVPGRPPFLQEVFLRQEGGGTFLRLLNSGFGDGAEWDEEYEGVDSGWGMALATLKHQLERHPDGPRTHVLAMRPAAFEYAALQPYFATPEGIEAWLGKPARLPSGGLAVGGAVELTVGELGPLTGEVLARSATEALVSWSERDAVLGFKAFSQGPAGRFVALDYNDWGGDWGGPEEPGRDALEAALGRAADALVGVISAGS